MDNLPCYSGDRFTWRGNCGVIEASDLGGPVPHHFQVSSGRTGRVLTFDLVGIEKDAEGECVAWLFVAKEKDVHVRVFND